MHRGCSVSMLAVLGGGIATLAADGDTKLLSYGKHLSAECTACHRIDGVDNGIPSIVGWSPDTFAAALAAYQGGARTNPVMVSVAQSLDAGQVAALAAYFGSLAKSSAAPAEKKGQPSSRN